MKQFLLVFTILSTSIGFACLNLSGTNLSGEVKSLDAIWMFEKITDYPSKADIADELKELRADLEEAKKSNPADFDFDEIHSDIGAYMIYDGDYEEAIAYLNKNVKEKKDNYSFCSNIGVAHELVGNLDSALYWTSRGLELEPDSHNHSEWLHVRILEVEIELKKDPNWLANNDIFDFSLSLDSFPTIFPEGMYLSEFNEHVAFQLEERTYFVKPENQDPVVAQLFLAHADCIARYFSTSSSMPIYAFAAAYDNSLQPLVDKRMAYLKQFNAENGIESYEFTNADGYNINHDNKKDENLNATADEDGKKKKKIIPGLIYYLGAGFVLLFILMVFYLRKKPKQR